MLSVCIPVFNFNIAKLINELTHQGALLKIDFEIIVIDDASKNFKISNKNICSKIKYIELEKNIGRSKIRNLFLSFANYEYLLFIDCDSLIIHQDYLLNYIKEIKTKPNIVCGGRIYPEKCPSRNQRLSWKYGKLRESKPIHTRLLSPNKSFMTNNFLIQRVLLEEIKFDERLTQYGHEDTLFGFELSKRNVSITHIENPVLNGEIENNKIYLSKTEKAIQNLVKIVDFTKNDSEFIQDNKLLISYQKIKKIELFLRLIFLTLRPTIRVLLTNGIVNLYLIDFYKLGTFIETKKSR